MQPICLPRKLKMYIIVLTETQMKLWIKIIRNEKIIKDTVTEGNAENAKELHALLADVCDRLNCPVPLVTTTDASNLQKFNHAKFKARDFVEKVDFDFLEAIRLSEKKKKQNLQE